MAECAFFINNPWARDMSDPNTPVLVGVSQFLQRVSDPLEGLEPVDMMVKASEMAAEDAGSASRLLGQIESVRVIKGLWRYQNPGNYVREKIGAPGAETVGSVFGGNMVQSMVNQSAVEILNGDRSLILITGAENGHSIAKAKKAGVKLPKTVCDGDYSRMLGKEMPMSSAEEIARDILRPIQMYPIFENAIRFERGESIEDHLVRISKLWGKFSQVASTNSHAWIRDAVDAETIRTATPDNRMVSFPYPKLMNSNSRVDMSAALILCSIEKAQALGIAEEKWIYPWGGTDAQDHYMVSNRDNLHSSPAIRIAGNRLLEMLNLDQKDLDFTDLYSCFPSAVQVAARELGLSEQRPLTVTGGLTFGGGPLNNYVMHSIARMVGLLREQKGTKGLITANGGFLTKHAFGVYSAEPPSKNFQHEDLQAKVDATPFRDAVVDHEGEVMIESYTVMYDATGASVGHAACLLPDGRRTWANTRDRDVMDAMSREEFCGRRAVIDGKGNMTIS